MKKADWHAVLVAYEAYRAALAAGEQPLEAFGAAIEKYKEETENEKP